MTKNRPHCRCFGVLFLLVLGIPCGVLAEKPASIRDEKSSGRSEIERILGGDRDHKLMTEIVEHGTVEDYKALRSEAKRLGGRTNADLIVGEAADQLGYRLAHDSEKGPYLLSIIKTRSSDFSVSWALELAERHFSPELEWEIERLAGGAPYDPELNAPNDWVKAQSQIALRKLRSIREVGRERAFLRASQLPWRPGSDRRLKEFKTWGIEGLSAARDPQIISEAEGYFKKEMEAILRLGASLDKRRNDPRSVLDRQLPDALADLTLQHDIYRAMHQTLKSLGRTTDSLPSGMDRIPCRW